MQDEVKMWDKLSYQVSYISILVTNFLWLVINTCMLVMLYRQLQRVPKETEKLIAKKFIRLIESKDSTSECVCSSRYYSEYAKMTTSSPAMSERRKQVRYQHHVDDMVNRQMKEMIETILGVTKLDSSHSKEGSMRGDERTRTMESFGRIGRSNESNAHITVNMRLYQ